MVPFTHLLLTIFMSPNIWTAPSIQIEAIHFRVGAELVADIANLDDGAWQPLYPRLTKGAARQWWTRLSIHIDSSYANRDDLAIYIYTLASYEIYWDGVYLGSNGQPGGDKTTEKTGSHLKMIIVPLHMLSQGNHRLALRMSSWHTYPIATYFKISAGPLKDMTFRRNAALIFYTILLALILVAGFWFLAYRDPRNATFARFGWLCIAVACLLVLEQGKHVIPYPYPWHIGRLVAISGVTLAVTFLLPWFLMARLQLIGRSYLFFASLPLLLFPLFLWEPDIHCYWMFVYSLGYSLFLCLRAYFIKRDARHSITMVIGICFLLAAQTGERFADTWFFPAFLAMVALLAVQLIWETKAWRKALLAEKLTSTHLEMGLLRKSIQPHFLKNTLAAALAWFEENPAKGSELLTSLAEELEYFFNIGNRERIAIAEELALCRSHIETMSYLMDCDFHLDYQGPSEPISLPPGLLITGIENAITHGQYEQATHSIALRIVCKSKALIIEMTNAAEAGGPRRLGTGTRYLKALLAHHFPGAWLMDQGWDQGLWRLTITIDPFLNQTITQIPIARTADWDTRTGMQ